LGFRVDPEEKLEATCKEIQSFHAAYLANPIFGVQFSKDKTVRLYHILDILIQILRKRRQKWKKITNPSKMTS
jgi:hypothetical protein